MDVESAATYLACKPARVYDLVSQGRLEAGRDERRLGFHRDDLDAYLRGLRQPRPPRLRLLHRGRAAAAFLCARRSGVARERPQESERRCRVAWLAALLPVWEIGAAPV